MSKPAPGHNVYPYLRRGKKIERVDYVWAMVAGFCVESLEEALAKHRKPEIFNADQGSQFTSLDFTRVRLDAKIAVSMDGQGAWTRPT